MNRSPFDFVENGFYPCVHFFQSFTDTFHFSANLLYPREDKTNPNALLFECRTCAHSEPATTSCIFRNKLNDTVGETAGVIQDVGQDPTVGFPLFCLLCGDEILCTSCGVGMDRDTMGDDSGYESEADHNATQQARVV